MAWVVERSIAHGFEKIRIQILTDHLDYMADEERREPGQFHRIICAIYPLDPRPAPADILSVEIERIKRPLHHVILNVVLKRGHYLGGHDLSIPKYDWEEYDAPT